MKQIRIFITVITALTALMAWAKGPVVAPSYAWKVLPPLGIREPATIDTLLYNYYQLSIPAQVSPAYATTGNLGAAGENMIFMDRKPVGEFFFRDGLKAWLPSIDNHKFYNTRIPMTLLSYNTGGGKENSQERLKMIFSGNANKRLQIGANLDYLYSKGSYNYQAAKGLVWGLSGSYIGDRYEMQMFYNHWNILNKENGGITDDLYITDPAELQGGVSKIDAKTIPTRLTAAHSRVVGGELFLNNRYKVGYWHETHDSVFTDSVIAREYIPVSSFIWTLEYRNGRHHFLNTSTTEDADFWENRYLSLNGTDDRTSYWSLKNTFGISLLEGFNKYAKAGLSAFATHEIRKYTLQPDTIPTSGSDRPEGLTPYPYSSAVTPHVTQNLLWVGGQLTKHQGTLLNYEATARFGIIGPAAGEIDVDGNVSTRFRLFGDTVTIMAYGRFKNETPAYLLNNYVSNHFIWKNDFGKTRSFRVGGVLNIPHTRSRINVGIENIQNHIYFNEKALPVQYGSNVQIFSASLEQNFKAGILNWNNRLILQTSTAESVIPLPKFTVYSNLFLLFKVARVLDVQFGIDCDYYTKYMAPGYQPATMTFYNQNEIKCGNYPLMNAYINMKLSKARFYVLFSHVNQGIIGDNNYFSMPHYPINPRRFQMGVSVDFNN